VACACSIERDRYPRHHDNSQLESCLQTPQFGSFKGLLQAEIHRLPVWRGPIARQLRNLSPHPQTRTSLVSYAQLGTRSPPEARSYEVYNSISND
jgi:hypothetical protein